MKNLNTGNWQKILTATVTATTITFITNCATKVTANEMIQGAGDSFSAALYQRYSQEYEKEKGGKFKYSIVGSGGGIRLFADQAIDIGATNLIPTPIERNQMKDGLLMIPTGGSSIAIVYNLQDVKSEIKLSREKLVQIFTGQITNWKQVNPSLPNQKIQVVVCEGSCGTSFILTKYLEKISGGKIPATRAPNWGFNVFSAFPQDSRIAGEIRRIDGAIGYVQKNFAIANKLSIASIENQNGRYVKPNLEETKKALENVKFNDNFTTEDITDPKDGYPLVSLTWLLVNKQYPNEQNLQATKNLLSWILTKGQTFNEELEYTKIPDDVAKKVKEVVNTELRVRPF